MGFRSYISRRCSLLKLCFIGIIVLSVCSFVYFSLYSTVSKSHGLLDDNNSQGVGGREPRPLNYRPIPKFVCPHVVPERQNFELEVNARLNNELKTEPRILVLAETLYSPVGKQIRTVLDALKFNFRVQVLGKSLPLLTTATHGRFSVIIFENYYRYLNMDTWNRQLLDKYCIDYGASIIGFLLSRKDKQFERANVLGFPLQIRQWQKVQALHFPITSPAARIAKTGVPLPEGGMAAAWVTFESQHDTYTSLLGSADKTTPFNDSSISDSVVVYDTGRFDGEERLIFGHNLSSWAVLITFIDGLRHVSKGMFSAPLLRLFQIDIDDIFVGPTGRRMVKEDVQALIEAQYRIRKLVPGFQFQLGFSGKYYQHGSQQENEGDKYLIEHSSVFNWFCHGWNHLQFATVPPSLIQNELYLNWAFYKAHNLSVRWPYAVSPHHSGVYPVHEPLYDAWKKVWNIRVTSTEEYPHLRPAQLRRAFIHRDIKVLPRQTCGLYTHTVSVDTIAGGATFLKDIAEGGELFLTILLNPFLIFMTHSTNYARDRLASSTFENAIQFAQCWTNLQFRSVSPVELARNYFEAYPEEKVPVWGNPCLDKRHRKIWSAEKDCTQFPRLIIAGPQKTGSTALHSFLALHPQLIASLPSKFTFEEVQFFSNNKNYKMGIDWYMDFFAPMSVNGGVPFYFEKSATYFDYDPAPMRVKALLPDVTLMILLINPIDRAYSWYQHQRAHSDKIALSYSFEEVVNAMEGKVSFGLWKLHQHCITPGFYSKHIEKWLEHFASKQVLLLDGELLKSDPVTVLNGVQQFLGLSEPIDYSKMIKFDQKKGYFCAVDPNMNRSRCLGKGKGRSYEPMSDQARRYLQNLYRPHNVALQRLMSKLGYSTPLWLIAELEHQL